MGKGHKQIPEHIKNKTESRRNGENFICVKCGFRSQKGKYIPIQAHHIKSFSKYPELRFELSNAETLCKDCHKKTENHAKHKKYHI